MRLSRDQLVFRALVVLDEAVEACKVKPMQPPGVGVRFALMYLYAIGRGDRRHFEDFWQELQAPAPDAIGRDNGPMRAGRALTSLRGIARGAGVELTARDDVELRVARMSPEDRRSYREKESRLAEHRRRLLEDGWQYGAEDQRKETR